MIWRLRDRVWDLSDRALLMGIVNMTPDSFSNDGYGLDYERAGRHALRLIEEGAEIIDIGGESTRPHAASISEEEEQKRVVPLIRWLRSRTKALISVDTSKASTAQMVLDLGADIINDVTALRGDERMASVIAPSKCGVILMHMQGTPQTMQKAPLYQNVVLEVSDFLNQQRRFARDSGIDPCCLVFDPGIGFGKTVEHNCQLLAATAILSDMDAPLLIGVSRKSFLERMTGATRIEDRLPSALALTSFCRDRGARIFRVHEVGSHKQVLQMTEAMLDLERGNGMGGRSHV